MKSVSIICFCVILFFLTGCKDYPVKSDPIDIAASYDTLMPLSLGNYWLYSLFDVNADGSGERPYLSKAGFIIDDTLTQVINGRKILCYKLFNCGKALKPFYNKPGSFEGSKLIYHGKDGLHYTGTEKYDTVKITFDDLIFPSPAKAGSFAIKHIFYYGALGNINRIPDESLTSYTCVSTDSLISTPAGDFRCVVYKMVYEDLVPLYRDEIYFFIKPKLGIVGMITMVYHYSLKNTAMTLKRCWQIIKSNRMIQMMIITKSKQDSRS